MKYGICSFSKPNADIAVFMPWGEVVAPIEDFTTWGELIDAVIEYYDHVYNNVIDLLRNDWGVVTVDDDCIEMYLGIT